MSIQYPGGTIVSTTFTGAVKQDIVAALETHLTTAGWSVVSGSGSTDVLMQSAATPTAANFIRVRLRSTNLTNCACINMQNTAADRVSQNFFLLPGASKTFRVIANKYQWFCFTPGGSASREFVAMGVPYTPSFLHGVITGELGWINGNGSSDSDTTIRSSLRTILGGWVDSSNMFSGLCNASLIDSANTGNSNPPGGFSLVIPGRTCLNTIGAYRWHDDTLHVADPLLAWGLSSWNSDEAKVRGQIWGAMVVTDPFTVDTTLSSVDSHDWYGITSSNAGSSTSARGTLFLAVT